MTINNQNLRINCFSCFQNRWWSSCFHKSIHFCIWHLFNSTERYDIKQPLQKFANLH